MNCHKCGNDVPDDSTFCPYCGSKVELPVKSPKIKKSFSVPMLAVVAASVCLVALITLSIWQAIRFSAIGDELTEVSADLKIAQNDNTTLSNSYQRLLSDNADLKSDLFFYRRYVVFADDKTNYYHASPNCWRFDSSSFYAFNTENAIAHGYTECPSC